MTKCNNRQSTINYLNFKQNSFIFYNLIWCFHFSDHIKKS
ncbi:hypothetical protein GJA_895 [Janthinobacterium agaricidamnosum NBRC 102515 = DSM 9628]|uniref:Uncharacterized protein n=1 Tax=Janthinobacterium agaricidamnosum NBRC 102515 = DSM 9628 TaxID=1349767 RepID=W0V105_9BURK|nr:hypothetical protein GJA_895 [Janthinobacterium agaricidamnosum NBRC 102515 = DSM 9628]